MIHTLCACLCCLSFSFFVVYLSFVIVFWWCTASVCLSDFLSYPTHSSRHSISGAPNTGRPWVHYKLLDVKHRIKIVSFKKFSKVGDVWGSARMSSGSLFHAGGPV